MMETKVNELSPIYPTPPPENGDDESLGEDEANKLNTINKNPPLAKLILSAIESLNKRGGSSAIAIAKYIKSADYVVNDDQRFKRSVAKALKMAITRGQVEQVKQSFKLTAEAKNESKALKKMKIKKEKKLEKEKKKANKEKPKATADLAQTTETKKAKKSKPSERKTGQAKKPKVEASEGKSKKAAAAASAASTSSVGKKSKSEGKSKKAAAAASTSSVGKTNTSRKSIGTLAKPKATKAKLNRLSIKKLVAAKHIPSGEEDMPDGLALASSTPQMPPTTKAKGKRAAPKTTKAEM